MVLLGRASCPYLRPPSGDASVATDVPGFGWMRNSFGDGYLKKGGYLSGPCGYTRNVEWEGIARRVCRLMGFSSPSTSKARGASLLILASLVVSSASAATPRAKLAEPPCSSSLRSWCPRLQAEEALPPLRINTRPGCEEVPQPWVERPFLPRRPCHERVVERHGLEELVPAKERRGVRAGIRGSAGTRLLHFAGI